MLIPSNLLAWSQSLASLSRRVNANSQLLVRPVPVRISSLSRRVNANSQREYNKGEGDCKLIKKGEC